MSPCVGSLRQSSGLLSSGLLTGVEAGFRMESEVRGRVAGVSATGGCVDAAAG